VPSIAETAYPRLKNQISSKELLEVYTPTEDELKLASRSTKGSVAKLGFLAMLKTFQRLGYFVRVKNVPVSILKHIASCAKIALVPQKLEDYDRSGTRWRHRALIRDYLKIKPYGVVARQVIVSSLASAARTKNDLADLINIAIEELVHHQYELPTFNSLVRAARRVRTRISQSFYRQIANDLTLETFVMLDALFEMNILNQKTPWHDLKQDPGRPILKNLTALVMRLKWLDEINLGKTILSSIPDVKVKYFAAEAMTLDAARMKELEPNKRYTLAISLIATSAAQTLDDIAEMFIKRMMKIHHKGKEALEYYATVSEYGKLVNLPVEGEAFVNHLKKWLSEVADSTDKSFPSNEFVRLENGKPIIQKTKKKVDLEKVSLIESLIKERLKPVNLLDILTDTEIWLNWTQFFHPISGHEAKIAHPIARYLATTFCYGCHLGPSQTARSLGDFDHRQVAWVNQRHITEETLDKAITWITNAYNRFPLPKFWGTGKRASADGTKWDIYEQNLLAEYHIRYGGYGGIGYYHVSDTYIALFSHFIPCGVWEAVYILDGLLNNQSEIQPDIIHADTQGQSTPVFGLAYLLGINLMPRIRNWQDLTLCRPSEESRYRHIDGLFSDVVDWNLIETHLPDMLRVALSIKAGKFTASTILRKLGTYSRHNRLYQAFSELGRVIRTGFLLEYLSSEELRTMIQAAMNKSESFNGFTKWVSFGGSGVISTNNRDEQRKMIKYNHLVSNCLIFYNVFEMTRILQELISSGYAIDEEIMGSLSPYITKHINRFGRYSLDLNRTPPSVNYDLPLIPIRSGGYLSELHNESNSNS
jgi:TnpA family transposase